MISNVGIMPFWRVHGYASVLGCTSLDDGVDLALLLLFDAPLDEDVRDGDADDDGEDDGDAVDAEAECLEQFFDGDGLDVEDGEEETVEENTWDEGDDGRDDEEGVRRVDDVDDLERRDADERRRHEGAERLRLSELEDEDVADEHGDDAFDGDDGEEFLRCVEHDGEATGGKGCCDRLIEVGVCGLDVDVGDVPHARDEDGEGDAEGQPTDDEHGVHGARHARCRW